MEGPACSLQEWNRQFRRFDIQYHHHQEPGGYQRPGVPRLADRAMVCRAVIGASAQAAHQPFSTAAFDPGSRGKGQGQYPKN